MLDYKRLLSDRERLAQQCRDRAAAVDLHRLESLYADYRQLTAALQHSQHLRKRLAAEFARAREADAAVGTMEDAQVLKEQIEALREKLRLVEGTLARTAMALPNDTHPNAPQGNAEGGRVVEEFGRMPALLAEPVDHVELGRRLDILDFEAGARTSGSAFFFLKGQGALLEHALVQYALSMAIRSGFTPILPPDIVNSKFIRPCGFFPRPSPEGQDRPRALDRPRAPDRPLAHDQFLPVFTAQVDGDTSASPLKVLAATSEIPLAAYHSGQVLQEKDLPIKWVALSHCFRPETGHHGAESRGLYRVHQFTKVELFVIKKNAAASSDAVLHEILQLQRRILTGLELRCRILDMAPVELGASAYQKYDIEAFFPVRSGWGELTSASNCTDFQARRLAIRYRLADQSALEFVHTLNGTALAIPRVIQAILENHQRADGSVHIPKVLHRFMLDGSRSICPPHPSDQLDGTE